MSKYQQQEQQEQREEEEALSKELENIDPNVFIRSLLFAIEDESIRANRNSFMIPLFFLLGIFLGYYINTIGV